MLTAPVLVLDIPDLCGRHTSYYTCMTLGNLQCYISKGTMINTAENVDEDKFTLSFTFEVQKIGQ